MPLMRARRVATWGLAAPLFLAPSIARADAQACAAAYEGAQIARQHGHLLAARDAARACAQASCPAVARKDCTAWSAELDREIPSVVIVAHETATGNDVPATRVAVDGVSRPDAAVGRAIEIDPGSHTVRVERDGDEVATVTLAVFQGQRDRIVQVSLRPLPGGAPSSPAVASPTPPPPAPSSPPPPDSGAPSARVTYVPAAIAAGVAVVALGTSAFLGLTGRSDLSDLRTTCAPNCSDDQVDPVRHRLLFSDVALGVGLLAAGVSVYFFARPPAAGPATTLDVGLGTVGVRRTF
jgi:hypothetical protein